MKVSQRFVRAAVLAGGLVLAGVGISYAAGDEGNGQWQHHGFCQRPEGGPMGGHGMFMGHMHFPGIHLTDKQKDQLFQLMHDSEPGFYQKLKALRQSRESLHQAAGFANYNPAQVRQLAEAEAKQKAELEVMHIELRHKMFALLTPEQQKQVQEHEKHHHHGAEPMPE